MYNPIPLLLLVSLVSILNGGPIRTLVEAKSNVHIVYLGEKKHDDPKLVTDSHHHLLSSVVGSKKKSAKLIVYSYKHGFSGFAAKLTESQAQQISKVPGVLIVIPNTLHTLQTTRSWDYLGLSSLSKSNLLHSANNGDGVIIGVFDSGIWPESKSFDETGLGPIPPRWKGTCQPGEQFNKTHCNRKIIGARYFVDGIIAESGPIINTPSSPEFLSPRDAIGHGTHTASTAAGAPVRLHNGLLGAGTARGGAPGARIAVYKVCWNVFGGKCSAADILKAFDEAVYDGVDVISLSLGGSVPLFSDVDDRDGVSTGSFHAVMRGIVVVCAGGNDGPWDRTVHNVAPWILTVAASGFDRTFLSLITLGNNKTFEAQSLYNTREIGFTGLLYPEASDSDPSALSGDCESLALNVTHTKGNIVLCFTSVAKQKVVALAAALVSKAGGVGLIVAKHPSSGLSRCSGDFPCISVDYELGTKILFYIRSTRVPLIKISPARTVVGESISPKVASFSSRGPNSVAPAILKPDIAAPGVNILAASSPLDKSAENGYAISSGTSMATPHVSGVVALLKALHPSWSPAAIKSALVTTAWTSAPSGLPIISEGSSMKPSDPFDFGGGIVNPNDAADPGLVYDITPSDYINYLCAMHYNTSDISHLVGNATSCPIRTPSILDLNLPSITIPSITDRPITVARIVTNVGASKSTYRAIIEAPLGVLVSVKPEVLEFDFGVEKIMFNVTVSTSYRTETGYLFGSLTWADGVHNVRIPLSVKTEMF